MGLSLPGMIGAAFVASITPLYAQSAPTSLIAGEMRQATCSLTGRADSYIGRGFSTFQRNFAVAPASTTKAVMSFPTIYDQGYDLSGQAVLNFTSATAGSIRFKQTQIPPPAVPLNVTITNFANYAETLNPATQTYTIDFQISFPDCPVITVHAVYDSAF